MQVSVRPQFTENIFQIGSQDAVPVEHHSSSLDIPPTEERPEPNHKYFQNDLLSLRIVNRRITIHLRMAFNQPGAGDRCNPKYNKRKKTDTTVIRPAKDVWVLWFWVMRERLNGRYPSTDEGDLERWLGAIWKYVKRMERLPLLATEDKQRYILEEATLFHVGTTNQYLSNKFDALLLELARCCPLGGSGGHE